ncbi:MAG: hypothetical protein ACR2QG_02920, partial [Gammaproteobacteria bacterium]
MIKTVFTHAGSFRPTVFNRLGFSLVVALVIATFPKISSAGPWVEVGDSSLRSDIQILADAGVIKGAITTWPLAWGD